MWCLEMGLYNYICFCCVCVDVWLGGWVGVRDEFGLRTSELVCFNVF